MELIIILLFVVAMYIVINKYEKKMEELHAQILENKEKIEQNQEKIKHQHGIIERLWVTIPETKNNDE